MHLSIHAENEIRPRMHLQNVMEEAVGVGGEKLEGIKKEICALPVELG
jgi:hypothetical protein